MTRRLASPLKRLGGKAKLAKWIIKNLPRHESYIEVFGGSAPVLMTKRPCKGQEVYNDLDGLWTNTWTCLRDHNDKLSDLVHATPYARAEFDRAREIIRRWNWGDREINRIELARSHIVVVRQSFSADGAWSRTTFDGQSRPKLWSRLPYEIRICLERLRGVYIEQRDYLDILSFYDHERATFYLDPPYFGVEDVYYDANREDGFDHQALRNAVEPVKGSVAISYYKSDEAMQLYRGWRYEEKATVVQAGDTKRAETEVLFIRDSDFARKRRRRLVDIFEED